MVTTKGKNQRGKPDAVAQVIEDRVKELEEERLEKELDDLDASMGADAMPDLGDTQLQRVQALLEEFISWDRQRATNKVKTEIAREAGDVEEAKTLLTAKPRIMKHLNIVVKQLVDVLAEADDVREEMVNWLTPNAMPSNLRPVLVKHLRERKGIDVSDLATRAQSIEEERRKLRRLTQAQG